MGTRILHSHLVHDLHAIELQILFLSLLLSLMQRHNVLVPQITLSNVMFAGLL